MHFVTGFRSVRIIELPPPLVRNYFDHQRPEGATAAAIERSCVSSAAAIITKPAWGRASMDFKSRSDDAFEGRSRFTDSVRKDEHCEDECGDTIAR